MVYDVTTAAAFAILDTPTRLANLRSFAEVLREWDFGSAGLVSELSFSTALPVNNTNRWELGVSTDRTIRALGDRR